MICTFGDITDVTWWRELSLPVRAVDPGRRHAARRSRGARRAGNRPTPTRAQRHYDELTRLSAAKARAKIVEQLRESGDLVGEPRPITHAVKFYEKGDRPLEIITSRQWFIKTIEFREALLAARPRAEVASGLHAGALRELDQRPERRLVRQPPAVLRRAVSGLVSARRDAAACDYDAADRAARGSAADRSVDGRARRLPRAISAARPAGSSAIPTSWTRGRPRRSSPQIVVRLAGRSGAVRAARSRWTCVRRRTTSSAPGSFDSVAARAPRARLAAVGARGDLGLGARSRPQEDVEVEGQRRDADGAARGARLGRRALLGGERAARAPTPRSTRRR